MCYHGREGSVLWRHSQWVRREVPMHWRSGMPRPPRAMGRHARRQLTRQWPPLAVFRPCQRNARRRRFTCRRMEGRRDKAIGMCVGIAQNTCRMRANRSPRDSIDAHHGESFFSSFSTKGWMDEAMILRMESGRPRYFTGKWAIGHAIPSAIVVMCSSMHRMGEAEHLAKFVRSPETLPKMSSRQRMVRRSWVSGCQKMTTSSA